MIISKINKTIREATTLNQWNSSSSVIDWFDEITNKDKHKFTQVDIVDFYPSISKKLLENALEFAREYTEISEEDIAIIFHARKTLLFARNSTWVKKSYPDGEFDVAMGAFDSAEVSDLVGLHILDILNRRFPSFRFGLYRDDGLAISKDTDGHTLDKARKDIIKTFKDLGLNITINTNLNIVDFLDVTLDLSTGLHKPYRKPIEKLTYIHKNSCHPPMIFKNQITNISKRISRLSSNKDIFNRAPPYYDNALDNSGHHSKIKYIHNCQQAPSKNRKRKTLWFAHPYSL